MIHTIFEAPPCTVPAVLYGEPSRRVWLYVHGKGGCKEEAEAFAEIVCPKGWQVLSLDLPEHGARKSLPETLDPWHAVPELRGLMACARRRWESVALRATSLGAWFSMLAFGDETLERTLFVSPVLDMERLIRDMMGWAGIGEEQLQAAGEIPTAFGETLSWRYLQYAQGHPITKWGSPTAILYAGHDNLTGRETADAFVRRFGWELSVMEDGEHWFHTPEQLAVLKAWEEAQS